MVAHAEDHPAVTVGETNLDASMVMSLLQSILGSRQAGHDPQSSGLWDPVIRDAAMRLSAVARPFSDPHLQPWGPLPEPWGPVPDPWAIIALNPQPLPPKWAFMAALANTAVIRAELIADLAGATGAEEAAPKYITMLTDELCPRPVIYVPVPIGWPPRPPRPNELAIGPVELAIVAMVFSEAARRTPHKMVAQAFDAAAQKINAASVERLPT